ncbi:hypothetical protein LUCX_319 [Xanthomonas phage vB_XciM_LucasX]|nr:hypothetical protein LUCX_319 [Xanthomonas phage vB_XciM_LucasX]
MSALTLLLTIGRELFPFLKEALLEGLTFRAWLKANVSTALWLLITGLMTLALAHTTDQLALARKNEQAALSTLNQLQEPVKQLATKAIALKDENALLKVDLAQLVDAADASSKKIEQYEQWADQCGLQPLMLRNTCPAKTKAARQSAPKTPPRWQPPQHSTTPQPTEEETQKRGLMQRIKDALSGKKRNQDE